MCPQPHSVGFLLQTIFTCLHHRNIWQPQISAFSSRPARCNGEIVPDCIDLKLYLEASSVQNIYQCLRAASAPENTLISFLFFFCCWHLFNAFFFLFVSKEQQWCFCSVAVCCFRFEPSDCGKKGEFQWVLKNRWRRWEAFKEHARGLLDSVSSNIKYCISTSQCSSLLIW